ncbi:Protein dml1 [Cyphellophora attinorum]|uniref:Protein DML1 n=1 Tax=Cyphellophora attinorum TaxID=1664694 RepID=A0A0N1NZN8_9EURO|nr:Protein dml1 [Phialophora attinorum]KPI41294.1 Protein dml1 [Phialophora attinorum]
MHEVITLQFGQRSNYLATHFWNAQESYFSYSPGEAPLVNHDVLFRPGLGEGGIDTFTPRTLIYDLKGGFGSLRKINALYEAQDDAVARLWDGSTLTQQQQPVEPSRYQTLLDSGMPTFQLQQQDVRYWSDFNRIFYHPRSAVQLNQYELNSELMPFENWSTGDDLFRDLDKEVDLLDRDVRLFAEECDQLQGMQLFTGTDDAWGGFAARYLDALRDEYPKSSLWVFGIENNARVERRTHAMRQSNVARSVAAFGQQASAYIPLATLPKHPPYIRLNGSEWLTSALQCVAIESATLPTRLVHDASTNFTLPVLESILNTNGSQNIFEVGLSYLEDDTANINGTSNGHASSGREADSTNFDPLDIKFLSMQEQSNRGIEHAFSRAEVHRSRHNSSVAPTRFPDDRVRQSADEETIVEKFKTRLEFPMLDSFPDGLFQTRDLHPKSLGVKAALTSTTSVRGHILQLRRAAQMSLSIDERESIYNDLSALASNYSHGWDSGSDSGEDD